MEDALVVRQCAVYHPNIWGDYFVTEHPTSNQSQSEAWMTERAEQLRKEIRSILQDENNTDLLQTMNLIDTVQLLGLDYHFVDEINKALGHLYDADMSNHGLYEVALHFRLLRQKGYQISSDVFNKFKDEEGRFKTELTSDAKGILSLYNAAYLGVHGETILDEAIAFTREQLTPMLKDLSPPLAKFVSLCLETPLRRNIKRLFARHFISIYQEEPTRNEAILELAKLDFNMLQSLHRQELKKICEWWKDLGINKSLSFARDRAVESYYWILGVVYEPDYSRTRMMMAKLITLTSILDDIYDDYSTLEESQQLTYAIKRWDPSSVDQLPIYLKDFYLKLLSTVKEFEKELAPQEKFQMFYLKEAVKSQAKAYFEESKWRDERRVPTVEEHLRVSAMSSCHPMFHTAVLVGIGKVATKELFEWVATFPDIIKASSVIGRIMNDITSYEREEKREHVASTVHCYMKEHGTSTEVACEKLQVLVEDAWKVINKECLDPTTFLIPLLEISLNFTRIVENTYKYIDAYTDPTTSMRECINLLLVQPVPL
ncbi:(S)-beta-bisabolene synthase-like [Canna indica]|uniref:(S)-beta-bisabolene synthase-like n=1 Tax=Canna indica TaxID=4628 RepID=A0AAQ3JUC9_9LILI|nr:(S)-beta-bisabolene synthase-like [Canna indica]